MSASSPKSPSSLARARSSVRDSVKRQLTGVVNTSSQAVTSGAWAYPLLGVVYIIYHPRLLGPVLPRLLRALVVSAAVVGGCFALLYLPQVAWLAIFSGPLAFIAAVPLVLAESYVLLTFLGRNFLLGAVSTDLFDAVLVQKGHTNLVERGRPVTTSSGNVRQLGRVLTRPLSKFSTDSIVRYVLTLPLNLVPVVGTASFLLFNGYKSGPGCHARYFQLKGWDKDRREAFIARRRGAYAAFGTVVTTFNLVPIVSVVLNLAATVGAALWAADLESKSKSPATESSKEVPVVLPESS